MIQTPPRHLLEPLNARQRLGLLLIDEIPDRVTVYPLISAHAAVAAGMAVKEYCTAGRAMARAQIEALRLYRHDAVSVFSDVAMVAEALGSRLYFPEHDLPVLRQPALDDSAAWPDLRLPDLGALPGRWEVYVEAVAECQREVGDVTPVLAFIPAPFTTAALLRGPEDFLADTLLDPASCHGLLGLSLKAGIQLADRCIEAGGIPMLVDPLASGSVISARTFTEFAGPYLRAFTDYLHRYDFDVFLHICGRTENILNEIRATGCDLLSCDDVPLSACRDRIGGGVRLIGNLRPADLLDDAPETVERKVEEILAQGKDNPRGFILSTGCEVPLGTPRENIAAFVKAGRRGGLYWGKP
ncbi:MAG: hypothetical protein C4524_12885 [Candidatus Zixiibacteriota bacterium]|nr:MAG: hypothetical protein C4524_12885 [candidate division Zixibacteria bacterium]